jgi:hypothetical protein
MGRFLTYPEFNHIKSSLSEEIERQVCDAQRSSDHQTNTTTSVSNRATTKKRKKPKIRFATWNVRTMYQQGRLEEVCKAMDKAKVEVLGLSEVRWNQSGVFLTENGQIFAIMDSRGSNTTPSCMRILI